MPGRDHIRIAVLGPVHVAPTTESLSPRQQLLLAALTLERGTVSADLLVQLLWPSDLPANPRAALQVHVSKLRRLLAPTGASVRRQGEGYTLVAERGHVDVAEFERLAAEGLRLAPQEPAAGRELLAGALTLWRGRPLDGLGDPGPLAGEVARLADTRLALLHARIEADLALGQGAEVVAELRQLLRDHPLHEGFWRQLVLALYAAGRAAEALSAYDEARRTLADELGADPAPELQRTHQRILRQDPTLPSRVPTRSRREAPASAAATTSDAVAVAVLPFAVIGEADDAAALAAGLHSDLLVELARIPEVAVISRMSVRAYEGTSLPPARVAEELGAGSVMTGTVQVSGDRFRLAVELLDAVAGSHVWAESYDAGLHPRNLLTVQRDLAQDIASRLSHTLTGRRTGPAPDPAATTSLEAYRLVAEARMRFDLKTREGLTRAVDLFRRAVLADPGYVAGWVGLAEAQAMTADYGYGDRDALLEGAEAAVVRSLTLHPDLPEVHVPLGLIAEVRHDAPTALAEYATAVRHLPGHADAHSWTAWMSLTLGDVPRAVHHARRAVRLNPLSAEAVSNLALSLIAAGDPAQGFAEAERAEALSPGYTTAAYYAGLALYDQRRFAEATAVLAPLATAAAGGLSTPWAGQAPDAALALSQLAAGATDAARGVLATIDAGAHPVEAGLVHLALGEHHRAHRLFAGAIPGGYGGAMLFHLHFRDLWPLLPEPQRADLAGRIARSWQAEPEAARR